MGTTMGNSADASQHDGAAFVENWSQVWRDHDADRWVNLLHADGVLRNPFGELKRDDLPGYMAGLVSGIADHAISPLAWGTTPDGVLIEWLMTGRLGERPLEVRGVDRFTLRDGRIVEGVAYFDPAPFQAPAPAPPAFDLREFAVAYDQAWQSRDPERIASHHAEDGTYQLHVAGLPAVEGRKALQATFAASLATWSDVSFTFDKAFYGDDFFVWQSTMHGVLAEPLTLGAVTIPADGKTLSLHGVDVISVDSSGLIASKETHFDFIAAANQAILG